MFPDDESRPPVIQASIDGYAGPFFLLVDTGAPVSVLRSHAVAKGQHFAKIEKIQTAEASFLATSAYLTSDNCSKIVYRDRCTDFQAGVFNEGILGLAAFETIVVTFDSPHNTLYLHPDFAHYETWRSKQSLADCAQQQLRGTAMLPTRRKILTTEVEGLRANLLFDSGAVAGSAIRVNILKGLSDFASRPRLEDHVVTMAGTGISYSIPVDSQRVGTIEILQTRVAILDDKHPFASLVEIEDGVLGSNFTNRFTITVDFRNNILEICRPPTSRPLIVRATPAVSIDGVTATRVIGTGEVPSNYDMP